MPNHLKFCSCQQCRYGLRSKSGGKMVQRTIRKQRRIVKQQLSQGVEPDTKSSVPYTD